MNTLRAAVVDDEPLARARLKRLLALQPDVELVGEYADAHTLIDAWPTHPADVVFLDIEMPEIDGFAALSRLDPPCSHVVFVTAYAEHAVRAFDVAATDYLVKPVAPERLVVALERVRQARSPLPAATAPGESPVYAERLALPIGRRIQLVEVDSIDSIEAQANYVEIRAGARTFVLRKPLSAVQDELDPKLFARVHRSIIVRIAAVTAIEPLPSARFRLSLANGQAVMTGRSYRDPVRQAFGLVATGDE